MNLCKCGCGMAVIGKRVFVNKEHQLEWMVKGGAKAMNALQPVAAKAKGGKITGNQAVANGRLAAASKLGAEKSRAIAAKFKAARE